MKEVITESLKFKEGNPDIWEAKGRVIKKKVESLGFSSFTNKVIEWAKIEIDYCGG